jgi:diguanylate cyclase (GGDEF)-like protein
VRPSRDDLVLAGRSPRAKFLFGAALAGLLPLLFLVYLSLPVLTPAAAAGTLYPKGAPVFFTVVSLLGLLQLTGFYVIYRDVIGRLHRSLDRELAHARETSAQSAGIVEELRRANLRLRAMSHTDELTEVGNRRNFEMRLREEISRSSRFGHAFALLMVDIDAFKHFNDEFGHPKGDAVLRALGALMRSVSREGDVPCRVGGEEFAFILPETAKADGIVFAERFRRRVESSMLVPQSEGPITVSVGLAAFPEDGKSPDEIVWAADEALYASKRCGRNRVTAFARPPEGPPVAVDGSPTPHPTGRSTREEESTR